jgi:simple sugar transport system permease protein
VTTTSSSGGAAPSAAPPGQLGAASGEPGTARRWLLRFLTLREAPILVVTIALAIYFGFSTSAFFTVSNFKSALPYAAPIAILAAGEVFLMINAEIDLSIGGVYLLVPIMYYQLNADGLALGFALVIAILIGSAVGLVNGFFTAIVGVGSFITTLGTLFLLEGLSLVISSGEQQQTPGAGITTTTENVSHVVNGHHIVLQETVNHTSRFANIFGAGTYSEIIWALAIVVVLQVALVRSRWGLYTVAVGSNRVAAQEAGIKIKANLFRNFVICSTLAGLVGILEAVRTQTILPDTGAANEILFQGISAAVIGGTLLAGGSGTVVGALLGAVFLGVLRDGLAITGVNAYYLDLWLGLAILFAMTVTIYVGKFRKGQGLG